THKTDLTHKTDPTHQTHRLASVFAVARLIALLERRAVLALVLVPRAVPAVVIVVAFAIPLRADRIVALAVARVVAAGVQSIAIAVLRRDAAVPVAAARDGRTLTRISVRRVRARVTRIIRSVRARHAVERFAVSGLEAPPECALVLVAIHVAATIAPVGVAVLAIARVGEVAPIARIALAVSHATVVSVLIGDPLVVIRVGGTLAVIAARGAGRRRDQRTRRQQIGRQISICLHRESSDGCRRGTPGRFKPRATLAVRILWGFDDAAGWAVLD